MENLEKVSLGYAQKCIPLGSREHIKGELIKMTAKFTRRLEWRVWHFLHPGAASDRETFGFGTEGRPKPEPLLKEFKTKLTGLVRSVEFHQRQGQPQNNPQAKLKSDIQRFKVENRILCNADKTSNSYLLPTQTYDNLLQREVTKAYMRAPHNVVRQLNRRQGQLAAVLDLADRVEIIRCVPAYVTLKDHKERFQENLPCRLINPCKQEIGKVAKLKLEQLNKHIRKTKKLNQFTNTQQVIEWFKGRQVQRRASFTTFDVETFYPSISEVLLNKVLDWAESIVNIPQHDRDIIMSACKNILLKDGISWVKTQTGLHDITMGSFPGAEVCELVGLYILTKLRDIQIEAILYRDDGALISYKGGRTNQLDVTRIREVFMKEDLTITIEANLQVLDFLDVTLDLTTGEYRPYTKPNNVPLYVHKESNHPPSVIRQIPLTVERRLSDLSSSKEVFDRGEGALFEGIER